MNNQVITKIQLVGDLQGYLDVDQNVPLPMNYSIGDVRDISKRNGSFSKTITLAGTKNNNRLLNYYFDVNILDGTFSVNKIQECILLKNNVPITQNAYMQLISVKKSQKIQTEDDEVTYEVVIKENIGDFFTKINNKELTDIDFSDLGVNKTFTANEIIASWNNTASQGGYKWIMPWKNSFDYIIQDFKPGIFAKQYWDRIHADAGYSYEWSTLSDDNVQFDKLIIPYNGDEKKTAESLKNSTLVTVDRTGYADYVHQLDAFYQTPVTSQTQTGWRIPGLNTIPNSYYNNATIKRLDVLNEVYDPNNYWTATAPLAGATGGVYTSPVVVGNTSYINYQFDLDYSIEVVRASLGTITGTFAQTPAINPKLRVRNLNNQAIFDIPLQGYSFPGLSNTFPAGTTTVLSIQNYSVNVNVSPVGLNNRIVLSTVIDLPIELRGYGANIPANDFQINFRIKKCKVTVTVNADSMILNQPVTFSNFVPLKIKQSDFLKSIYQMYNLYIETDPTNPQKLIYKHRDQFYDSGTAVDWTSKFARDEPQDLKFLPELVNKKIILTYKEDNDPANKAYTEGVKEIYGQQEVIFQNEYVKNVETKKLIFSPTPSQKTVFNAACPLINGLSPSNNIRILLDNGKKSCANWKLFNNPTGAAITLTYYPLFSHFDDVDNPHFDINFGVCDYYFYNILYPTSNNLYTNFWRRTMAQIDNSRLLTAYFWLDEYDIQRLKLNDKIRIDNSWWNINKIIDFDASADVLTKVELISIDPDLDLPTFGKPSRFVQPWVKLPVKLPVISTPTMAGVRAVNDEFVKKSTELSNVVNSQKTTVLLGANNLIGSEFTGVVSSQNGYVRESGYVIEGTTYTKDGQIARFGKIVDGGQDMAYNRNTMSRVTLIDGTNDYLGVTGGSVLPINADLNWGNPIRNGGIVDLEPFPL